MAWEFNPTTGEFWWSGVASAGGSDTQIQYNNAGALDGGVGLTWNSATSVLSTPALLTGTGTPTACGVQVGAAGTGLYTSGGLLAFAQSGSLRAYFDNSARFVLFDATTLVLGNNSYIQSLAANHVALVNGSSAQRLSVYNTFTDASNYERGVFDWSTTSNVLTIGTQKAGTGTLRDVDIVHGTDAKIRINNSLVSVGPIFSISGAFSDVGVNAKVIFYTPSDGVLRLTDSTQADFGRLTFGGTTSSFPAIKRSGAGLQIRLADDSANAPFDCGVASATKLSIATGTITTSQPALDATQTWNAGGVTFTALKLNVTDTASAAGSLLLDLQLASSSLFTFSKTGRFDALYAVFGGFCYSPYFRMSSDVGEISLGVSNDVVVRRIAANHLGLSNASAAQSLSVYNTYTDASNYERGVFDWSTTANTLTIGTQKAGTGSTRGVNIVVGATTAIAIDTSGNVNFGASVYFPSGFALASSSPLYWLSRTVIYSESDGTLILYNQANTSFDRVKFGGNTSSFPSIKRSTTTLQARLADDSAFTMLESSQIKTNNGTFLVSGTALTDGAAAAAGTLLNAPAAGNPTKWIPIDDNGTTRYIPCW